MSNYFGNPYAAQERFARHQEELRHEDKQLQDFARHEAAVAEFYAKSTPQLAMERGRDEELNRMGCTISSNNRRDYE